MSFITRHGYTNEELDFVTESTAVQPNVNKNTDNTKNN